MALSPTPPPPTYAHATSLPLPCTMKVLMKSILWARNEATGGNALARSLEQRVETVRPGHWCPRLTFRTKGLQGQIGKKQWVEGRRS